MPEYTSALSRSLAEKLGEHPSVLDWIPGNLHAAIFAHTSTDDVSEYIQAAIDAIVSGELFFPPGLYYIGTTTLTVTQSHVRLVGAGGGIPGAAGQLYSATRIRYVGDDAAIVFGEPDVLHTSNGIRGIGIDLTGAIGVAPEGRTTAATGLRVIRTFHFSAENIAVRGMSGSALRTDMVALELYGGTAFFSAFTTIQHPAIFGAFKYGIWMHGNGVDASFGPNSTVIAGGSLVGSGNRNITVATLTPGTPVQIETVAPHGLTTGDYVYVTGLTKAAGGDYTALNYKRWQVTVLDGTNVTLDGSDSEIEALPGGNLMEGYGTGIKVDEGDTLAILQLDLEGWHTGLYTAVNYTRPVMARFEGCVIAWHCDGATDCDFSGSSFLDGQEIDEGFATQSQYQKHHLRNVGRLSITGNRTQSDPDLELAFAITPKATPDCIIRRINPRMLGTHGPFRFLPKSIEPEAKITGFTAGAPCVITAPGHNLMTGDACMVYGVRQPGGDLHPDVNGLYSTVTVSGYDITLTGTDSVIDWSPDYGVVQKGSSYGSEAVGVGLPSDERMRWSVTGGGDMLMGPGALGDPDLRMYRWAGVEDGGAGFGFEASEFGRRFNLDPQLITDNETRLLQIPNADVILAGVDPAELTAGGIYDKGDMLVGIDAEALAKLPVGADGEVLMADASEPTGLKWSVQNPTDLGDADSVDGTGLAADDLLKWDGNKVVPSPTVATKASFGAEAVSARVTGDSNSRAAITGGGELYLGPGNAVADVKVLRPSAGRIRVTNAAGTTGIQLDIPALTGVRNLTFIDADITVAGTSPAHGGTGQTGGYTKGDLLVATGSTALAKLPVGSNGQTLQADSAQASGLKWASTVATTASFGAEAVTARVTGDTNSRAAITGGGELYLGPGNAVADVKVLRPSAGRIRVTNAAGTTGIQLDIPALTGVRNLTFIDADITVAGTSPAHGGTGQTGGYTKGDLLVATGSTALAKQAVGSNGQVLTADSAMTNGLKWATPTTPEVDLGIAAQVAGTGLVSGTILGWNGNNVISAATDLGNSLTVSGTGLSVGNLLGWDGSKVVPATASTSGYTGSNTVVTSLNIAFVTLQYKDWSSANQSQTVVQGVTVNTISMTFANGLRSS